MTGAGMGVLDAVRERLATSDTSARMHRRVFRSSGGRVGARVEGRPVLLLTTTGWRTGRRRDVVVVHFEDDGRHLVVPSNAADPDRDPGWWRNLQANPEAEVLVDGRRRPVVAMALPEEERDRLWPSLMHFNPHWEKARRATSRHFPIVALVPRSP